MYPSSFTIFSAWDIHVLWQMNSVSDLKFVNTITGRAAMVETNAIAHVILTLKFFTLHWNSISDADGWRTNKIHAIQGLCHLTEHKHQI